MYCLFESISFSQTGTLKVALFSLTKKYGETLSMSHHEPEMGDMQGMMRGPDVRYQLT